MFADSSHGYYCVILRHDFISLSSNAFPPALLQNMCLFTRPASPTSSTQSYCFHVVTWRRYVVVRGFLVKGWNRVWLVDWYYRKYLKRSVGDQEVWGGAWRKSDINCDIKWKGWKLGVREGGATTTIICVLWFVKDHTHCDTHTHTHSHQKITRIYSLPGLQVSQVLYFQHGHHKATWELGARKRHVKPQNLEYKVSLSWIFWTSFTSWQQIMEKRSNLVLIASG